MKARVKATGEIVEVSPYWTEIHTTNSGCYEMTEVELMPDVPDYWTRLEHQYVGMAMQALLSSDTMLEVLSRRNNGTMEEEVAREAFDYAHALVKKMKEVK